MSKMARSQSCQDDGGMSNCSSNLSHSPASQKMTQEKRERRSIDRKQVGGVESRSIKDEHAVERGRSRSKSPRRNSWREEIKQIKSWKDERENREIKFEDIRHDRQGRNRGGRASQRSSKCYIKEVKAINKFDLLSRRTFIKKEARLEKETPCRGIKKSYEKKEKLPPPLVFQTRGERLSRWKQVKKSSNIVNDVEVGLVTRRKAERKGLDKSQTNQDMIDSGGYGSVLGRCSKDFADSDDELELRISDKDIFPELRDEQVDRESAVPDVSMDGMKGKIATKNNDGSEIKMKKPEGDDDSSQRSVKLVDDRVKDVKYEKKIVRRDSKLLDHEISTVVMGSLNNEESCTSSTSSDSMMHDEDSSAMARNFSLLELKMEVYTTRLKELEWEREQLRKEREVFKDKELFVKRDLVKSLLEQKMFNVNFNLCEKENKEIKG